MTAKKEKSSRAPAFLVYVDNWLSGAPLYMTANQRGWFFQMLVQAWASKSHQAQLVDDEVRLRRHSGFDDSKRFIDDIFSELIKKLSGITSTGSKTPFEALAPAILMLQEKVSAKLENEWNEVIEQFVREDGLIFHKRQFAEFDKWRKMIEQKREAGSIRAKAKWKGHVSVDKQILEEFIDCDNERENDENEDSTCYKLSDENDSTEVARADVLQDKVEDSTCYKKTVKTDSGKIGSKNLNLKEEELYDSQNMKLATWIDEFWFPTAEQSQRLKIICADYWPDLSENLLLKKIETIRKEFVDYWIELRDVDQRTNSRKKSGQKKNWYSTFKNRITSLRELEAQKEAKQKHRQQGANNGNRFESTSAKNNREQLEVIERLQSQLQDAGIVDTAEDSLTGGFGPEDF